MRLHIRAAANEWSIAMAITLSGFPFEGPFYEASRLPSVAGIYVPLDHRATGYYVLDVGETGDLRERVSSHDRAQSWTRNSTGNLGVWIYLMPGSSEAQ